MGAGGVVPPNYGMPPVQWVRKVTRAWLSFQAATGCDESKTGHYPIGVW